MVSYAIETYKLVYKFTFCNLFLYIEFPNLAIILELL